MATRFDMYANVAALPQGPVTGDDYDALSATMEHHGVPADLATAAMTSPSRFARVYKQELERVVARFNKATGSRAMAVADPNVGCGYQLFEGTPRAAVPPTPVTDAFASAGKPNFFKTPPEFNVSGLSPLAGYESSPCAI